MQRSPSQKTGQRAASLSRLAPSSGEAKEWAANDRAGELISKDRAAKDRARERAAKERAAKDRCHELLYEDALARQQRQKEKREIKEANRRRETESERRDIQLQRRERQRFYTLKDTRTHDQREEATARRKEEKMRALRAAQEEKERGEMLHCTFRPALCGRRGASATPSAEKSVPRAPEVASPSRVPDAAFCAEAGKAPAPARRPAENGDLTSLPPAGARLRRLLERQLSVLRQLSNLDAETQEMERKLQERCNSLHEKTQGEETQRVIDFLHGGEGSDYLRCRVEDLVATGSCDLGADMASRIVQDLVWESQDEVRRRVIDTLLPEQKAAEVALYRRRLALVHALEKLDVQSMTLSDADLRSLAAMGFRVQVGEDFRKKHLSSPAKGRDIVMDYSVDVLRPPSPEAPSPEAPLESSLDVTFDNVESAEQGNAV